MRRLLTLAAALAVGALSLAPTAQAATGDSQLAVTDGITILHTIRHADGTWDHFGRLANFDQVGMLASVIVNGEENLFFTYLSGMPYVSFYGQYVRHTDGTWSLGSGPGGGLAPGAIDGQAVADVNGHIAVGRKQGNTVQVSIQQSGGTWSAWETVPTSGTVTAFAMSASGGALRVVTVSSANSTVTDYDRSPAGVWSAGNQVAFKELGAPADVAVAQVGSDLEVVVTRHYSAVSDLYHTVLHANGKWDQFGYIEESDNAGQITPVVHSAVAAVNGTLQIVASANGALFHTIRYANGTWQHWGYVDNQTGGTFPGTQVTLAGDN